MGFPFKHIFWALIGGTLSALLAIKVGMPFWLTSIIILSCILLLDYLVHLWRMGIFTNEILEDYEGVYRFVAECGSSLMVGTKEELKAIYGIAYMLPPNDDYLLGRKYRYFCISDSTKEKQIMAKYNIQNSRNLAYHVAEFLF